MWKGWSNKFWRRISQLKIESSSEILPVFHPTIASECVVTDYSVFKKFYFYFNGLCLSAVVLKQSSVKYRISSPIRKR